MTCGIYCITNTANGKKYIGQSVDIEKRFKRHKYGLMNNKHFNKHLQCAWNKYGPDAFTFEIIQICDIQHLDMYERLYIIQLRTFDREFGYNIEHGGNYQKTVPQAVRDKISRTFQIKEINQGESNPMYGKQHTEDAKIQISKNTTTTGVYGVACSKDGRINQGYCFVYTHPDAEIEYQSIDIMSLKKRVIDNGYSWTIVDEDKYKAILQKNKEDLKKYPSRIAPLGIQYVSKKKSSNVKQGFLYRFSVQTGDNKVDMVATDITKLEKKVKDKGYDWVITDSEKAKDSYEESKRVREKYGRQRKNAKRSAEGQG